MKYNVILQDNETCRNHAKECEELLEEGKTVMFDRDMRGQLVMVGWPYFEGTMRKDGRSMMLMEGSVIDCFWTYIRSKKFKEDFSFGWPKDLIVAEA